MFDVIKVLQQIATAPTEQKKFDEWLEMKEIVAFLKANTRHDEFVLHAIADHIYMHSILVSALRVNPPDAEDLLRWHLNASSSWGVSVTFSNPPKICLSPPLEDTGSKTLDGGEQLVFVRHFDGFIGEKNYYELLQKFIHAAEIHFVPERNAYCRLDKRGDIEDVVRIVKIPGGRIRITVITVKRSALDEYLALTDSVAVRTFDFTFTPSGFSGWSNHHDLQHVKEGGLFYRFHLEPGHASYMRGCQIVRTTRPPEIIKETIVRRHDPLGGDEREYASFIVQDWRHRTIVEVSCAPGATCNYFNQNEFDLPFELSPAFFRPEVLAKYKADSEKYHLDGHSISCRGTWSLESYDINSAGQVHAYLCDLRHLPYEEQVHWKLYNEPPKAPISERAFKADFQGSWDLPYDPLVSLKHFLLELNQRHVSWWTLRSEKLVEQVHYPVTASADEWANEILQLDQLVIEGFEGKWLKNKAQELGRDPDPQFGSLKLAEECLTALGFAEDDAKKAVAPLRTVHDLRSKLKGHASGKDALTIKQKALTDHGSYNKHFHSLCEGCDKAIRIISEAFEKLP